MICDALKKGLSMGKKVGKIPYNQIFDTLLWFCKANGHLDFYRSRYVGYREHSEPLQDDRGFYYRKPFKTTPGICPLE